MPTQFGTLFTDTFDRTTGLGSNYTTAGTATWTVNNNADLVVSGGTSNYTRYARYSTYKSCLEKFAISISYTLGTVDSTSKGLAIGANSINTFSVQSVRGLWISDNGANTGKLQIVHGTTQKVLSTGSVTPNTGDAVTVTFTRLYNVYTIEVVNHTTSQSLSQSYTFATNDASGTGNPNNTCNYTLYALGGTQTVSDWTVSSIENTTVTTCVIGDSITNAKKTALLSTRYASLVNYGNSDSFVVHAGGGNTTQQVLDAMSEILAINATNYILMIGGNDIEYSVATATWQANYDSIVSQLKAIGATVVHCTPTARNSVDVTPLRDYINTTYSADPIVDTYTRTVGSGTGLNSNYNSGDGIHPNTSGHRDIADYIIDNAGSYIPTLTQNLNSSTTSLVIAINAITTWDIGWTRRQLFDNLIVRLQNEMGIDGTTSQWDSIAALWLYASYESGVELIDIVSLINASKAGTTPLVWNVNTYLDGNSSGYINTAFNPGDGGSHKFTQNDASYFCAIQNNAAATVQEVGCLNGSNLGFNFDPRNSSNKIAFRMNGGSDASLSCTNSIGHFLIKRANSTTIKVFQNGVQIGSDVSNTSSTLVNGNMYLFASNNNGTAASFSSRNKWYDGFGNSNVDADKLQAAIEEEFFTPQALTI